MKLEVKYSFEALSLTKGIDESFVFTPKETSYQATPKVHVTDTVGAGDSFTCVLSMVLCYAYLIPTSNYSDRIYTDY